LKFENKSKGVISKANLSGLKQNIKNTFIKDPSGVGLEENYDLNDESNLPIPGGIKEDEIMYIDEELPPDLILKNKSIEIFNFCNEKFAELKYILGEFIKNSKLFRDRALLDKSSSQVYFYTFSILFIIGIGSSFLRMNFKNDADKTKPIMQVANAFQTLADSMDNVSESARNLQSPGVMQGLELYSSGAAAGLGSPVIINQISNAPVTVTSAPTTVVGIEAEGRQLSNAATNSD